MTERQFSDDEVAAIFKQASEAETQASMTSGNGMTLSQLQDIGREAGMSSEAIARAALALDKTATARRQTFLGLPVAVGKTVEVQREFTETDWQRLIADLRTTFNARGVMRQDGAFREWRNGNLQALIEPTPTGFRLRLKTMNENARALMTLGLGGLVMAAALWIGTGGTANPKAEGVAAMFAIIGTGLIGLGAIRLPGWARRRKEQMDEIASRSAVDPQAEATQSTGRIPD